MTKIFLSLYDFHKNLCCYVFKGGEKYIGMSYGIAGGWLDMVTIFYEWSMFLINRYDIQFEVEDTSNSWFPPHRLFMSVSF